MVEFRDGSGRQTKVSNLATTGPAGGSPNFSTCRFCLRQSSPDHPVMDSLCSDKDCVEYSKMACTKVHNCGHYCGGILNEEVCLPCLHGCSGIMFSQISILLYFCQKIFDSSSLIFLLF